MQLIGLTGPTGAGKGYICKLFFSYGIPSIDCDAVTRQIYTPNSLCLLALSQAFGKDILNEDGTLRRQLLAQRAFTDAASTKKLNELTHPWIRKAIAETVEKYRKEDPPALILDAPTLIESGIDQSCDVCICVTAPYEVRAQRILLRDQLTKAEAELRLKAQPPLSVYQNSCTFEIVNDGVRDCREQVEKILRKLHLL